MYVFMKEVWLYSVVCLCMLQSCTRIESDESGEQEICFRGNVQELQQVNLSESRVGLGSGNKVQLYIVGSMAEAVLSSGLLAVLGRFLYEGILFVIFTSMGKMPILSQIVPLLLRKGIRFFFYGCLVCIPVLFFTALLKNRYIILCMPFILIYLYDLLLRNRNIAIWETTGILYYPWKQYLVTAGVWMAVAALVLMIGCYCLIKRRLLRGTW